MTRRPPPLGAALAALLCAACATAPSAPPKSFATRPPRPPGAPPPRASRVVVDSATRLLVVHDADVTVYVRTATAGYAIRADSAIVAELADTAEALPAPGPASVKTPEGAGTARALNGVVLRELKHQQAMRILRLGGEPGDSLPRFELDVSDGTFSDRVRLAPDGARAFFAALRGTAAPMPDDGDPSRARYEWEVDEAVKFVPSASYSRRTSVPPTPVNGSAYVECIVGVDGRVEPESIELRGHPPRDLAERVRETVLGNRYVPATMNGIAVRQRVGFTIGIHSAEYRTSGPMPPLRPRP